MAASSTNWQSPGWRDRFDRVPVGVAPFGLGEWDTALGSHRAVVRVAEQVPAVCAYLPWRRRDRHPESKHVMVMDAATGRPVANSVAVTCNREYGEVVFEPVSGAGEYYLYYLVPMDDQNAGKWPRWAFPITRYMAPRNTARPDWLEAHGLTLERLRTLPPTEIFRVVDVVAEGDLPAPGQGERVYAAAWRELPVAELVEFQARTGWDTAWPMETIATEEERLVLEHRCWHRPFLLFPENRTRPIRMTDTLPHVWAVRGDDALGRYEDHACRNEYFVFQVGVYAFRGALADVRAEVGELRGPGGAVLSTAATTCLNLEGVDQSGRPFRKTVHVDGRRVQALWFGVDIPADARPGRYEGVLKVSARGLPDQAVALALAVSDEVLADRGDGDGWRLSRLRWLNSKLCLDTDVCAPYTALEVDGRAVKLLGRRIELGDDGVPARLTSHIEMFDVRETSREILAAPARLQGVRPGGGDAWLAVDGLATESALPGRAVFRSRGEGDGLTVAHRVTVEQDGCIEHRFVVEAKRAVRLDSLSLVLRLAGDVARLAVGADKARGGGACPDRFELPARHAGSVWIGDTNAGLGLRVPVGGNAWENGGAGRLRGERAGPEYVLVLETGPLTLAAGTLAEFVHEIYVTPFKPLPQAHWDWRYYHAAYMTLLDVPRGVAAGARIFTQHHETESNPFISYPFLTAPALKAMAEQVHAAGGLFKFYYTIRELSVRAPELWALRSLGDEILTPPVGRLGYEELADRPLEYQLRDPYGHPFTGMPWLCEHLGSDYHTRWHSHNQTPALRDGSLQISGASRWANFFIEGVRWLMANAGLDGLYFDGVTFDREALRRVRKTLVRAKPHGLIDYHGDPTALHLVPFFDSLWFGEGADYKREPEYWLAMVSGIPFGVPGELLLPDASVARGMVHGLCQRYGWMSLQKVDPSALWRWWDEFGIAQACMMGYWQADCPVHTDHPAVKASAYVHPGKRLAIAVASWADAPVTVRVDVNWAAVGLAPDRMRARAPELAKFQPELDPVRLAALPIEPGKGWLLEVAPADAIPTCAGSTARKQT